MITEKINPTSIAAAPGAYSQGILVPGPGRWLYVSGQGGLLADGSLAAGFAAQATAAWQNVLSTLRECGMAAGDLVKITSYLVDAADLKELAQIRSTFLGEHRPASTLLIVKALARPDWLVEVEAVAWRP